MVVPMEEARGDLQPFFERFYEVLSLGVESFKRLNEQDRAVVGPTTRANYIHDWLVYYAVQKLATVDGIRVSFRRNQFLIYVRDKYRIRLKKLDKKHRPSNYPTQRALSYLNQTSGQVALWADEQMPSVVDLIAGYEFSPLGTGAEGFYIVCPQGRKNFWHFEIEANEGPDQTVVDLPPGPSQPDGPPKKRVRVPGSPGEKLTGERKDE